MKPLAWGALCLLGCAVPGGSPGEAPPLGDDAGISQPQPDAGAAPWFDAGPVVGCSEPIDVVFAVDVSTSMTDDIAAIRAGLASIWRATTMLTSAAQFSLVVFVDDVVVVDACRPFATVDAMQAELQRWQAFCATSQNPASGTDNYDCAENSLDALYLAATSCPWRPEATHVLIHVTDDTFVERPAMLSDDVPVQHTYGETVAALRAAAVRVGAFASPSPGEECGAGSSPLAGAGFHDAYRGMPSLAEATGGRAFDIRAVRDGRLDMATAINEFTAAEHCTLF
jgi:hypothetical protein